MSLVDRFIRWATRDTVVMRRVVTFDEPPKFIFSRYEFLRIDEADDKTWGRYRDRSPKKRPNVLPWWMPFNVFLHHWSPEPGTEESYHDHPRWSVTICLRGRLVERTPWGERLLRPGSVVLRSRKCIHAFRVPEDAGDPWTLFVVGRRRHRQNTFVVTPR